MVSVSIGASKLSYMDKKWFVSSTRKDNLKCLRESFSENSHDLLDCVKTMPKCDNFNAMESQIHHMLCIGLKNALCRFKCETGDQPEKDCLEFLSAKDGVTYVSTKSNGQHFLDIKYLDGKVFRLVFDNNHNHEYSFQKILQWEVGEGISNMKSPDIHDLIDTIKKTSKNICLSIHQNDVQ